MRRFVFWMRGVAKLLLAFASDGRPSIPVGGQAVIEGVLMKGPEHWGLAVRTMEGNLWKKAWRGATWLKRGPWKLPVCRGFAVMVEMLRVGMRSLSLSAQVALGEEEAITAKELVVTALVAIGAVVGLFIALPVWISDLAVKYWGASHVMQNVIEGIVRAVVFVGYVAAIGAWKEIARVFAYHGAEHKVINAYENGSPLEVDSVMTHSRIHRRCGTSFLLVVVMVSILVFACVPKGSLAMRAASRVVLLPLVIGISYEIIKAAGRSESWGKWAMAPALSLQYLTTREPDRGMVEVALCALGLALDPGSEEGPQAAEDVQDKQNGES